MPILTSRMTEEARFWPISDSNKYYWVLLLAIIQVVGILGFVHPMTKDWFVYLTPFHLVGNLALLLTSLEIKLENKAFLALAIGGTFAWSVEAVGVNTGVIFGHYWYGDVLGPKLTGTPIIIAVNWLLLLVSSIGLLQKLGIKEKWQLVLGTGVLLTGLDLVIEPVAIGTGMWFWQDNHVPFRNYLAWFITSCLISSYLTISKDNWISPMSVTMYLLQWIFFVALYILLPS